MPKSLTDPTESADVPWEDIRGISDVLRHEYMNIRDEVIYKTARDFLKPLAKTVKELKQQERRKPVPKKRR